MSADLASPERRIDEQKTVVVRSKDLTIPEGLLNPIGPDNRIADTASLPNWGSCLALQARPS